MYIARPEVIEQQAQEVAAPIKHIFQARKEEKFAAAQKQALATWMQKYPLTPDCVDPRTDLKQLECRNKDDIAKAAFERKWQERLASGWEPE